MSCFSSCFELFHPYTILVQGGEKIEDQVVAFLTFFTSFVCSMDKGENTESSMQRQHLQKRPLLAGGADLVWSFGPP